MSAIPELKWTSHPIGDVQQWKADSDHGSYKVMQLEVKNEAGNEWQLVLPDNRSLYYQTAEEAKAEAERDNLWKFKLMLIKFKAEKLAGDGRKYPVAGQFIFPFAEVDLSDPERQLRDALEAHKLQSITAEKLNEIFFGSLPDYEQTSIARDLKASGYWLHFVQI